MSNEIKIFENKEVRSIWDIEKEEWYFSVIDVVGVLTESSNPRRYWSDLKQKIKDEEGGIEVYEKIVQLKMKAQDGKMRVAEATTTELTNKENPQGLEENKKVARDGGNIAGEARKNIEKRLGEKVISKKNAIDFSKLILDVTKNKNRGEK
ncbi:MAG: hypothetical protein SPJ84_08730 [Fusobacterium gastrosuis]|uniref:hypothetical protein n=3 Tax=Fusobacterium TaxID=848 RepID=UPI002A98000A|nr:hypothetical protein [Fusobacterium gastrosuis]